MGAELGGFLGGKNSDGTKKKEFITKIGVVFFFFKNCEVPPARMPEMLDRKQYCGNRGVTTVTAEIYGFHPPKMVNASEILLDMSMGQMLKPWSPQMN